LIFAPLTDRQDNRSRFLAFAQVLDEFGDAAAQATRWNTDTDDDLMVLPNARVSDASSAARPGLNLRNGATRITGMCG
jgi:hypothetical protein